MEFKLSTPCAPVFVPLDNNHNLLRESIASYYMYLRRNGIQSIMVNGGCGEFTSLTVVERKTVLEAWIEVCEPDMEILVNIGSCNFFDTVDLGRHALQFDNIHMLAILPPFYMAINNEYVLLNYIKSVKDSLAAAKCRILYYHIPSMTKIDISLEKLVVIIRQTKYDCIAAIKYTDASIEELCSLSSALNSMRSPIQLYCGYEPFLDKLELLGLSGVILGTVNIFPELLCTALNVNTEPKIRQDIIDKIKQFFNRSMEFSQKNQVNVLALMKYSCEVRSGLELGPMRNPYNIGQGCAENFRKEILEGFLNDL